MYKYLKNNYIKRTFAVVLIAIFALSNTPKQQLHSLFAGHSDISIADYNNSKLNISKTEFHCHCDNLVVIAPFIGSLVYSLPPAFKYFSTFISEKNSELSLFQKIYFELRGPPAFA